MARITKPPEERRKEFVDTARDFFIENGYEKTQMIDITKKLNVAAGTIYHYFKSKTELLYAVIDEETDEKARKQRHLLSESQGSAYSLLNLIFTAFENDEANGNFAVNFTDDPAIIQYYLTKLSNSSIPLFESLIERGNTDGSWNCEYPLETAVFVQQGLAAILSIEKTRKDSPDEKSKRIKVYENFVLRILDILPR